MIHYTTSKTDKELLQILELQKNNLPINLSKEQIETQGFVTVSHTLDVLQKMNGFEQSIIAKDEDKVVAYLLAMSVKLRNDVPVLIPMFDLFDHIEYKNRKLSDFNYIVVGQVCVADGYRGQGVLDKCYLEYKNQLSEKYDFAVTEISKNNLRSEKAHKRIGFESIHEFKAPDGEWWNIVLWDWSNSGF